MLIQNNINLWHFSRWINVLLASPQCCRHQVMDRGLRANIKIKICHLNHSMNVSYLNFWHLIYSNSEPMLVAVFVGDWYAGEDMAMNYSIIWFLKPRLRSLCGRTIELRITTSEGMLTLQPGGTKKKNKAVFGRWCVEHFNYFNLPVPSLTLHESIHSHQNKQKWMSGQLPLTEDGDWGCEFSIDEEGLAVDLCVRVVGVWVTWGSLDSRPLSDGAVPSHNAVQNTGMILEKHWQIKMQ